MRVSMFRVVCAVPLAALLVASAPARCQYAEAIDQTRELLALRIEEGVPGMSVAVGVDNAMVWAEGFGYADVEEKHPVTTETRFRIGSTSKPVTVAGLGLLIDAGKVDIDVPIQTYVPYYPEKRWAITSRQLAGNLSGTRHYRGLESLSRRTYESVQDALTIFQDDPLEFEPGTQFLYSSYGFNILSAVIEGASGQEFVPYMQSKVFGPLGMVSTGPEYPDRELPNLTTHYSGAPGKYRVSIDVNLSNKWASGGMISTPSDLVRFGLAHLQPGFLSRETLDLLFTSQNLASGQETGYGMGWRIHEPADDWPYRIYHHGGASVGGLSMLMIYPDQDVVVGLLINLDRYMTRDVDARQIAAWFADAAVAATP